MRFVNPWHQQEPYKHQVRDFPGGTVDENPPANAGTMSLIPALGGFHVLWSN